MKQPDQVTNVSLGGRGRVLAGWLATGALTLLASGPLSAIASADPALSGAAPRIVGGVPATPGQWPWLAFVEDDLPGGGADLCSGTVVAPNVVLTAGHCVVNSATVTVNPAQQFSVTTGSLDRTDTATAQVSSVSRVAIYPGYAQITDSRGSLYADGDAALLQLAKPTTAPVMQLASSPGDAGLYTPGTGAAMAGWGRTSANGPTPSQVQWGYTVVQSTTYCSQQAARSSALFDSVDQTCVIDAPTDTTAACFGDSGGPLIAASGQTAVEIGIASHVEGSCDTTLPDYYTRVDALSMWINNTIQSMAPPTVTTIPATSVGKTSAQLNGQLNPNGTASTYYFQWGNSTAYGNRTSGGSTNDGVGILPVSDHVSGLSPSTTYHYRLVASGANGTTYGADQTFTTAYQPPPPSPPAGRYVGSTSQGWLLTLRVGPSRRSLTAFSFSYGLRCTLHRPLAYGFSPLGGGRTWNLNTNNGLGFSHTVFDNTGTRYHVAGMISTAGKARGTLSATWRTPKYGTCASGTVAWTATRRS